MFLQLTQRDIKGEERVFPRLCLALGVARDRRLNAGVGCEAQQQNHDKPEERDDDQQCEASFAGRAMEGAAPPCADRHCSWGRRPRPARHSLGDGETGLSEAGYTPMSGSQRGGAGWRHPPSQMQMFAAGVHSDLALSTIRRV